MIFVREFNDRKSKWEAVDIRLGPEGQRGASSREHESADSRATGYDRFVFFFVCCSFFLIPVSFCCFYHCFLIPVSCLFFCSFFCFVFFLSPVSFFCCCSFLMCFFSNPCFFVFGLNRFVNMKVPTAGLQVTTVSCFFVFFVCCFCLFVSVVF